MKQDKDLIEEKSWIKRQVKFADKPSEAAVRVYI